MKIVWHFLNVSVLLLFEHWSTALVVVFAIEFVVIVAVEVEVAVVLSQLLHVLAQ